MLRRLSSGKARWLPGYVGLLAVVCASSAFANDLSEQPVDSLTITGILPSAAPQALSSESSWLRGLHISGYGGQTFGMWQNPTALHDYTPSRNNLAVARTLLQVDERYDLNHQNSFFMREWFVYEPPYSFESANNPAYAAYNQFDPATGLIGGNCNPKTTACSHPASFGHFMNDWYNVYQVRDAWWQNKLGPLTTYIGNQIVVWGQSISFRVGDVINPVDTAWNFGFANLEQSRNAQWMLHPILNLPDWSQLSSNFVEAVVLPGFQPQWWENDYADGRYVDSGLTEGRVDTGIPAASHGPSARFDVHYDNSFMPGLNGVLIPAAGGPPFFGGPFPGGAAGLVTQPSIREFWACTQLEGEIRGNNPSKPNFANPMPVSIRHFCNLGLSKNDGVPYGPSGDGALVDVGHYLIPGMQPSNWNDGVRVHTLLGQTELTALYYNDNTTGGAPYPVWRPYTNIWDAVYSDIQEMGVTADRPVPLPESLAEHFPAVFRGEEIYINHQPFFDARPTSLENIRYSDEFKWMAALDLDQAYAPWLTATGNLTANVEVEDNIIMDHDKLMPVGSTIGEPLPKNDVSTLLNIGTSWRYGVIAPTWTMIYNPRGETFALFPSLILTPPWTPQYFLKLQAIEVLGGNREADLGLYKGQSLLTAQFQYNFSLL
jgi:hypothetical protein